MFKSIVVAFDGSRHAARALQIGAELAAREDAALGIVYVIDESHFHIAEEMRRMGEVEQIIDPAPKLQINFENAPEAMISNLAQVSGDTLRVMQQYAEFLVGQAATDAARAGAKNVETSVEEGDPADEIIAWAKDRDADLIVCGNRGLGRWKSLLLGSTSSKITQLGECSCLTVK
jgi:nucleotide-binding universal stress UspA family protein